MKSQSKPRQKMTPEQAAAAEARRRLWLKGVLDWKLRPHQKIIYDAIKLKQKDPQNIFVLHASRRLGKTFVMCILALEQALQHPGSIIKVGAVTSKQAKETWVPMISQICDDAPKSCRPIFSKNHMTFRWSDNESVIELFGLAENGGERVRGAACHLAIIDEAGFVANLSYCVKSVLFPATLTTKGQIILASNSPLSPEHDFCTVFIPQTIKTGSYLKRTIYDNSDLSHDDISRVADQYGGASSTDFKREFMCEFVTDANRALVPEFPRNKYKIVTPVKDIVIPPFFKPCVAIDLGFNDATAAIFGFWDFQAAKFIIQAELLLHGVNSSELVRECRAIEARLWPDLPTTNQPMRFVDGQLYSLNDLITVHNFIVQPTQRDSLEASVNGLRIAIQDRQLVISEECVSLVNQLETGMWAKSKTGQKKFERQGSNHQDLVACLCYFVRSCLKTNPFPPGFNSTYNPATQWKPAPEVSQNQAIFGRLFNKKMR